MAVGTTPQPSAAVQAGRRRKTAAASKRLKKTKWFIKEVSDSIALTMKHRVQIATVHLRSRVTVNLSVAVVKGKGPRGGRVITGRSKPGEFPHAETTQLMRTIFGEIGQPYPGVWEGWIGTPLSYGLILETKMHRSFLKRTLDEELGFIKRVLTGPIK